ncbi:Zinc finger protein MSN4 [Nakaseomyces bracarensis]|uniref:Zinc finger protein MSN4 n=1 Tax=Nakaseomyces bracarensis TaxID=273131 RepID=A0ABR4NVY2_9SACH
MNSLEQSELSPKGIDDDNNINWSTQMGDAFSLNLQQHKAKGLERYQSPETPFGLPLEMYGAEDSRPRSDLLLGTEVRIREGNSDHDHEGGHTNTTTTTTTNSSTAETNLATTPATLDDFVMSIDSSGNTSMERGRDQSIVPNKVKNDLRMNFVNSSQNENMPTNGDIGKGRRATIYNGFFESMHLDTMLDDYLSTELLLNENVNTEDNSTIGNDRRHSEVLSNKNINLNAPRNSISHGVDFWNLESQKKRQNNQNGKTINGTTMRVRSGADNDSGTEKAMYMEKHTGNNENIDSELNQILSDYNLNFKKGMDLMNEDVLDNYPTFEDSKMNELDVQSQGSYKTFLRHPNRSSLPILSEATTSDFETDIPVVQPNVSVFKEIPWQSPSNNISDTDDIKFDESALSDQEFYNSEIVSSPKSANKGRFIKPTMILSDSSMAEVELMNNSIDGLSKSLDIAIPPNVITKSMKHQIQNGKSLKGTGPGHTRRRSSANLSMNSFNNNLHYNINTSKVNQRRQSKSSASPNAAVIPSNVDKHNDFDKPFGCHLCTKAFKRSEHLKRHIRSVHSTERPFACHLCDKKFSRSDNLSQHIKTHQKIHN